VLTKLVVTLCVLMAIPSMVYSQEPYMVLSDGASTCGEYVAEPQNRELRVEWVLGYISGLNAGATGMGRLAGKSFQKPSTVDGWLQSYCTSHSLDTLVSAAMALRADFLKHENPAAQ